MTTAKPNLAGKRALVTGGTRGIGLATGLALARCGASCVLTYRWGSVPNEEVQQLYAAEDLAGPTLIEANAADPSETKQLMEQIAGPLDIFISNAANACVVNSMEDYNRRAFLRTMEASTWPTFDVLGAHHEKFGTYPKHVVVMSSDGPDNFAVGYDFVAASKAALEAMCRYASHRLAADGVRLNVLRSRGVRTDSIEDVFGTEIFEFAQKMSPEDGAMEPQEVADMAVALCSGWLDSVNGQVITADKGAAFSDNVMGWFDQQVEL